MKKRIMLISAALLISSLCGCSSVNVNIKTAGNDADKTTQTEAAPAEDTNTSEQQELAEELAKVPQMTSEDFDYSKTDDDKNKYFECHGNTWTLTSESADKYPQLAKALEEIADSVQKFCQDTVAENEADAKKFAEENKGGDYAYFECDADIGPACVDEKVTSLVETQFLSLGGAHPSTVTIPFNLDSQTGEFIPLSAVINDQKGLNAILKEKLIEQYTDHSFFGLDESLDAMEMTATDFTQSFDKPQYIWSFSPNGLTFSFNPADIAPYSDGGEQIDLTYDELSSVLEDHFKNLYSGE